MDMDSTLINEEGIDLLAERLGVGKRVAEMTATAMAGKSDFYSSLQARVSLLQDHPTEILATVTASLSLTKGGPELIRSLQDRGWMVAVVSGGFHEIIDDFLSPLHLDLIRANRFDIQNGRFTGKVITPIIGPKEKAETLIELSQAHQIPKSRCIAIGDGANDREMLQVAGIGIAFCAKDALKRSAQIVIDERDLALVLEHIPAN